MPRSGESRRTKEGTKPRLTLERRAPVERPARSPVKRGSLSAERIVGAALLVLARDGLSGLTMRQVAEELGTAPMSLYRHVDGHAGLVDLVRTRVMSADIATPSTARADGWRARLRALLQEARARLRRHPGAVVLFDSEGFRSGRGLELVEQALGCLVEAGVAPSRLASTSAALWTFTVGSVLAEQSTAAAWPGEELVASRRKAWVATTRAELGGVAPRIVAEAATWSTLSHDQVFADGLELLLSGIDRAGA